MVIIYKVAAALLQPICEQRLVNILNAVGNNLLLGSGNSDCSGFNVFYYDYYYLWVQLILQL